jgi:hypothetical protein
VPFGIVKFRTLRYTRIATLFLLGTVVTICFLASQVVRQALSYSPLQPRGQCRRGNAPRSERLNLN